NVGGGSQGTRKITIWLDGDNGVSVDDCARLSRKVGEAIETLNLIETAYVLEVSSAGIDQPLKFKRQYQKNVGRRLDITLLNKEVKTGKLTEVKENSVLLDEEIKEKKGAGKGQKISIVSIEIPFDQIMKSNVLIAFN